SRTRSELQACKSETCVHSNLSASIARIQLPGLLSNETPNTVNPLSLNSLYCCTIFGFSCLQGAHHDAQKSTNTYCPRKSESFTVLLFGVKETISGAGCPTASRFNLLASSLNCDT